MTSRCDVAYSGRENLHHFLLVLLRGMLPLFSTMTLLTYRTRTWTTIIIVRTIVIHSREPYFFEYREVSQVPLSHIQLYRSCTIAAALLTPTASWFPITAAQRATVEALVSNTISAIIFCSFIDCTWRGRPSCYRGNGETFTLLSCWSHLRYYKTFLFCGMLVTTILTMVYVVISRASLISFLIYLFYKKISNRFQQDLFSVISLKVRSEGDYQKICYNKLVCQKIQ